VSLDAAAVPLSVGATDQVLDVIDETHGGDSRADETLPVGGSRERGPLFGSGSTATHGQYCVSVTRIVF
jgi:hypothetical protein